MLSRLVIDFLPSSKRRLISWLQSLSTVILETKKIKSVTVSIFSPFICHEAMGPDAMILVFWMLSFKPAFHSPLSPSSRGSLVLHFCRKGGIISILRLLIFLPAILIPACPASSPALHITYFACNLNKQGDNIQPWRTLFRILNQSTVTCSVLSAASWPAHGFLGRQVRWSGIPISWRTFHSWLWSTQSKALA